MNTCARCGSTLIDHEEIHAIDGKLYCSKDCAVQAITDDYIMNAKEMALEAYASEAEVVSAEDILGEDMRTVRIIVSHMKQIKVPKNLTDREALAEATRRYNDGTVFVDQDNCDETVLVCELVKKHNSPYDVEV